MRQPDIEIYLKDADVDHKAISAWLGAALLVELDGVEPEGKGGPRRRTEGEHRAW